MIALIGDGTAMYTIQALWTMAREGLNVTAIIFNNASYSVLNVELERVGAEEAGPKAKSQLDLKGPVLHFAQLAQGMGVHAVRTDAGRGLSAKRWNTRWPTLGPHLIEAVVPESLNGRQAQGAAVAAALAAEPAQARGPCAEEEDRSLTGVVCQIGTWPAWNVREQLLKT